VKASITVDAVEKVFALAEHGGRPVPLREALRRGKRTMATREVRALHKVSFEVHEGERVGIIGPNGAGKTTLLSILAGLTEPSAGRVEVEGDVHAMLTIGALLREDLTGRENIDLDASVHGRSSQDIASVADLIVEFSELGEFINRPVRTYSSGMKARLAFSMGAFIDPDILIVDETLAAGDAFFAQKAQRRMRAITAAGRIVILVTHGMASIVEMCTRCIWLDRGTVMMDGAPEVVTKAYEASVRDADEKQLLRKFSIAAEQPQDAGAIKIDALEIVQGGRLRQASVAAMVPLTLVVRGGVREGSGHDVRLSLLRVDGRCIWSQSLLEAGGRLPERGPFTIKVEMDPFILGADLYRLDVTTLNGAAAHLSTSRVFEVVDEQGQYGGKPLVFCPPSILSRPKEVPT
jgi:lipopolysaccharide transport system ATP-binding protein